ncbi:MAG: transcription elongation factor GreA [Sphingobacteriia bacterium]|jgi:transcription elongation factor GreA|nr:transcription elongation factor GreA [Sphingobacteriia bacterium]
MAEISYFTEEGLASLKAELHELKTKGRAEIAHAIAEAREKGDLSENAEYDAAREAQGHHELRISKLEDLLANARIVDSASMDMSKITVLSKAKLKNLKSNTEVTYYLVSEKEANFKEGKISVESPIGKGLLGKSVGDTVEIKVPAGVLSFEVLEIGR